MSAAQPSPECLSALTRASRGEVLPADESRMMREELVRSWYASSPQTRRHAFREVLGTVRGALAMPEVVAWFNANAAAAERVTSALHAMADDLNADHEVELAQILERGIELKVRRALAKTRLDQSHAAAVAFDPGADWIDQYKSPLGRRKHLKLCRDGVLPCEKNGKQRLVRRADLDAYLVRESKAPKAPTADAVDRELDAFNDVIERTGR